MRESLFLGGGAWRQPLDCAGLTALWLSMEGGRKRSSAAASTCARHVCRSSFAPSDESQSGVKPPQSKASRHSDVASRRLNKSDFCEVRYCAAGLVAGSQGTSFVELRTLFVPHSHERSYNHFGSL